MFQHIIQMSLGELLTFNTTVSELYLSIKPTDLCKLHSSNNCGHDVENCMETELKLFFCLFVLSRKDKCPSTYFGSCIVKLRTFKFESYNPGIKFNTSLYFFNTVLPKKFSLVR